MRLIYGLVQKEKNNFFFSPYLTEEQAVAKWETGESEPSIERLIVLSEVFNVTIDSLIKGAQESDMSYFVDSSKLEAVYKEVQRAILNLHMLSPYSMINLNHSEAMRVIVLKRLYAIIEDKFIDANGRMYDKYLLCNSTIEERKRYIFGLDGEEQLGWFKSIEDYVNGKMEIDAALKLVEEKLLNYNVTEFTQDADIHENKYWTLFCKIRNATWALGDWEDCSTKKQAELINELEVLIAEFDTEQYLDRVLKAVAEEVLKGMKSEVINIAVMLEKYHNVLGAYIQAYAVDMDRGMRRSME